jgi:ELWxxDGT repeat protein
LLFVAADGSHGLEPWKSNGTAKSTGWVGNVAPGNAGSNPGEFVVVGKFVFFPADDGSTGEELWGIRQ